MALSLGLTRCLPEVPPGPQVENQLVHWPILTARGAETHPYRGGHTGQERQVLSLLCPAGLSTQESQGGPSGSPLLPIRHIRQAAQPGLVAAAALPPARGPG